MANQNEKIEIAQKTIVLLKDFVELEKTQAKLQTKSVKEQVQETIDETTQTILFNAGVLHE